MKSALLVVLQTVLFFLLFAAGTLLLPFFPAFPTWQVQTGAARVFVLDGPVLVSLVFLVILAVEAGRKQMRGAGSLTTLAFVLALVLGLAMKLGFKSL